MPGQKANALEVDGDPPAEMQDGNATGHTPPADRFEQLLGYQLRRAQKALYSHFSEELAEFRLTPGQIGLLFRIRAKPGISQAALAKDRGIERATLGPIVDRFEARGLVERRNSPYDRRSYALHMTEKGDQLLDTVWPRLIEHEREFFANLSAAEKEQLSRYLQCIAGSD